MINNVVVMGVVRAVDAYFKRSDARNRIENESQLGRYIYMYICLLILNAIWRKVSIYIYERRRFFGGQIRYIEVMVWRVFADETMKFSGERDLVGYLD